MSIIICNSGSLLLFTSFLVSNLNFFSILDFAVCVLYSSSREAHGSCLRKLLSKSPQVTVCVFGEEGREWDA